MIISVSRRTDIVAFYMPWFMNRVRANKAVYYNPFNFKGYEISLKPKDVDVLVFISKDYQPLLPYLDELKSRYNLYFHYTITGLSGIFEERVPPIEKTIPSFKELAKRTSSKQVEWRFDPIVLTNITPPEFYRKKFLQIASRLEGYTHRCYFSFATIYDKVKRNFKKLKKKGIQLMEPDLKLWRQLADELASLGRRYGIQLYSCCNDFLISDMVKKGRCIDGEHLSQLFNLNKKFHTYPTREGCGCAKCVDLGVYDTCPHGCIYCYANVNKQITWKNYKAHSPEEELLIKGKIEVVKRLKEEREQMSLF
ncbi:hypothetical protein BBF96_03140 [Anoxybacter fermentans]|uniref:DUF1848 domain-containing protein n=1 Tax=Anoxybacter fermentans TaxID=1323375 RepID=A0A3Q9HP87_9FIRM|nr:DUF1848 domain-containing protein [Anoxybacter fermentans]AZR72463.1 hypothetical protein BBF96_03140 [Anoxybacter fermentans]